MKLTKAGRAQMAHVRGLFAKGVLFCPGWGSLFEPMPTCSCDICHSMFYGLSETECPTTTYSRRHLLRVIDRLLEG